MKLDRILSPILLALCLTTTSCSPSRPPVGEWNAAWEEMKAALPSEEALRKGGRETCGNLLVATRSLRARLLPTPERALDAAVRAWLEEAGGLAFECPSAHGENAELQHRIRELRVLTAEVDAAVALEEDLATE